MNKKLKLGFMPTRRAFFSKEDAFKYKGIIASEISGILPEEAELINLEWLNDEGLLFDDQDAEKVADFFISQKVDALFAPHCNFGCENAVAQVARRVQKPLLLWGPRDEAPLTNGERLRDSQCGLFATSKVLQRYGVKFTYIVNSHVTDTVFHNGFINFLRAANVIKYTKNIRIGHVASRPQTFYSIIFNESELLEKFGIEVVPFNLGTIIRQIQEILKKQPAGLNQAVEDIKSKSDLSGLKDETILKIAALKHVLNCTVEDFNLQALSFQCWDELQFQLGICSCYVHALMTDEGLPVACEADVHGAISSLMLQAADFFRSATFFSDLTIRHPENDNAELLWHCGAFPPSLCRNKNCSNIGEHFVLPSHAPGTCNWELKKGDITVIRFDGIGGNYSLFCGEGKAVEGPFTKGTYIYLEVEDWPLWEEKIIYGPYIHHTSCIFGKYAPVLYEATRYLDVTFDPANPTIDEIQHYLRNN